MTNGRRMVAIAVGIADSVPPKHLGGAINGAHAFEKWASFQGHETVLVTDEAGEVTMTVLRRAIEKILSASDKPIHRIIVYFAGHGLIRELEEGLWLLSDWRRELRAVAVEVLKRRLSMYGPHQVCIISDACRSLPADVEQSDLVPDSVLGAGPKPVDMTVAVDKFIATQDGAEAFMIPGEDPDDDRCLFSGVLVEGLWGVEGLREKPFSKLLPDKITSRSLGAYLQVEVPTRAKDYELTLVPTVTPTFPEGDDYYFSKDPAVLPPKFPAWPPKGKLTGAGPGRPAPSDLFPVDAILGYRLPQLEGVRRGRLAMTELSAGRSQPTPPRPTGIVDQLRAQTLPNSEAGTLSGIAVPDANEQRLWLGKGKVVGRIDGIGWSIKDANSDTVLGPTPALIELSDGLFAAMTVLPYLFAAVVRDRYGVTGLLYRDLSAPPASVVPTEDALAALEEGTLRADAVTDLAVRLREGKHVDPVLGVISAYLYDAIGDTDSIRRMASFYARESEAIPYDIALLGGLAGGRTERGLVVNIPEVKRREPRTVAERQHNWTYCQTEAAIGLVGGYWPWMRQGWIFLDYPSDVGSPLILPGLVELRSGLMRSRFATLEKDAGLALARLFSMERL